MSKYNENGTIGLAAIIAVVMMFLFIGATGFGVWAFLGRQDFKNNTDQKIDVAVEAAKTEVIATKDKEFAEQEKSPVKTFAGPATLGTVVFDYPKTYSAYMVQGASGGGATPIDGYFYPGVVPAASPDASFALRFQVISTNYDQVVKQFDSLLKTGKVSITPFRPEKVPEALGIRIDGEIITKKQGSMVLVPLRDKTLKVWTESKEFTGDLDTYILPSLSFIP